MKDDFKSQPWLPEVQTFDHFSSREGVRLRDKAVSTLNEECQTGMSPCDCPICTRLQQQSQATWKEAEEVLRMLNRGEVTQPMAESYFIGKGFVLFRNPDKGPNNFSIGSNVLAGELSPGARPEPPAEPEKSESERRWSAIADEITRK